MSGLSNFWTCPGCGAINIFGGPKGSLAAIAEERRRQMVKEGWSKEHDASHHHDESLACAAACYAMPARFRLTRKRGLWRWASRWWKPTPDDRRRELVKAGALIAAEIDRLDAKQMGAKR